MSLILFESLILKNMFLSPIKAALLNAIAFSAVFTLTNLSKSTLLQLLVRANWNSSWTTLLLKNLAESWASKSLISLSPRSSYWFQYLGRSSGTKTATSGSSIKEFLLACLSPFFEKNDPTLPKIPLFLESFGLEIKAAAAECPPDPFLGYEPKPGNWTVKLAAEVVEVITF